MLKEGTILLGGLTTSLHGTQQLILLHLGIFKEVILVKLRSCCWAHCWNSTTIFESLHISCQSHAPIL